MSFWGVEVKPNYPFTLDPEDLDGKLVLTQATLGTGSATKKSTLQVNVGDKSPVFLCTLLPDKSESCSLNLVFEESDDVKFSVVGPTSVHLSGFVQEDIENYSEDIDETDSQSSDDYNAYVDDFIDHDEDEFVDHDDADMFPSLAARKSGVSIEEILDDEKDPSEDGGTERAKKKKKHLAIADKEAEQQIAAKSDDTASFLESEDDDGFPVSRAAKSSSENSEANLTAGIAKESKKKKKMDEAKDDGGSVKSLKRKVDAINHADEQKSDATETANGDASEDKKKKKKKKKKGKKEKDDELANVKQDATTEDKPISKTDKEAKESNAKSAKVRTYPNGLVVEEIGMGKPNGKRASRGSKVSVHYIGKLQKNNKHFDSNTGKKPFKFRLGIGQVIKGWDVGLEVMVHPVLHLRYHPMHGYSLMLNWSMLHDGPYLPLEVVLFLVDVIFTELSQAFHA
ncbi:Peptidyl-prolyl cis-trans isomerase FKBP53 [Bienertia sinuspersici]